MNANALERLRKKSVAVRREVCQATPSRSHPRWRQVSTGMFIPETDRCTCFGIMRLSRHRGRERIEIACMDRNGLQTSSDDALAVLSSPVRAWFQETFSDGPTPAQQFAWPIIAAAENVLLVSPTGTGKTLAAFLAILDQLFRAEAEGTLSAGVRCVYVSPLRSLNYDIERNLRRPLDGIWRQLGREESPIRLGVRTGDTTPRERRRLRDHPPHVLITTPESLSLLLSQESWRPLWRGVRHVVIDEVHALAPTKRGADLAVSLERLANYSRARSGAHWSFGDLPLGQRSSSGSWPARLATAR